MYESINRLEQQAKVSRTMHYITLVIFIVFAISIVYLVKSEINDLKATKPFGEQYETNDGGNYGGKN